MIIMMAAHLKMLAVAGLGAVTWWNSSSTRTRPPGRDRDTWGYRAIVGAILRAIVRATVKAGYELPDLYGVPGVAGLDLVAEQRYLQDAVGAHVGDGCRDISHLVPQ